MLSIFRTCGLNSRCPKYIILTSAWKGVRRLMKKMRYAAIISLFILILTTTLASAEGTNEENQPVEPEPRVIRHIILVSVDGLTNSTMNAAHAPNLNGLASQGVKTSAIGVLPPDFPNFAASLLTGSDPSIHGFTTAGKQIKTETLPDTAIRYGRTAAYVTPASGLPKGLFRHTGQFRVTVHEVNTGDNQSVMKKSIEVFGQKHPYFLGITLSLKSSSGKAGAIVSVDNEIGKLFRALNANNIFNETLVIITGNVNKSTNSVSLGKSQLMVPVIMAGPGLKSSVNLPPIRIIDIAPTAALLSGMKLSPESNGLVIWNALKAGNGFVEENLMLKRVKDLSSENVRSAEFIYRLQEEKRLVRAEQDQLNAEKLKIQQTISGKEQEIEHLKLRIILFKMICAIAACIFGAGYILEYFYLRKKFLMF